MKVILISGKAQNGKDESAKILKDIMEEHGEKVLIAHYADLLKYICKTFFKWDGVKDDNGRSILQYVGTDIIRKQEPNYWVDFISKFLSMFGGNWDYVLIPDTRFPNEIEKMIADGYDVISMRITRTDYINTLTEEQRSHPSETALDNYNFDIYINTISNLNYLKIMLENAYTTMKVNELKQIER